ncbi:PaaI family thioesterase [Rhizobiales bacterium]|uniref:PaaI family thioesterase n=1 Tax=Hongsoonwoonella zoysiae TaxID=2821844 RepID=UPI001561A8E0|nr:PaaI family thioesterase [Hongsoonwoonella zoysiae]NRG19736.1 PaaI family thioesterase [Hongsoonwoonella zoysiae]
MDFNDVSFGLADKADLAPLSGREVLERLIAGDLPAPPICETMNFMLTSVSGGEARFEGIPEFRHYNPLGTVHGGWAGAILDSALGCAVHTTLAPGEGYTTVEFKVNIVRPILETSGRLVCDGRVVHRGRRIATSEATLKDGEGRLLAHGTETCMIFSAPGQSSA